jgi:hypothetical protein
MGAGWELAGLAGFTPGEGSCGPSKFAPRHVVCHSMWSISLPRACTWSRGPRGASARGAAVRHLAPSGALLRRHAGPATGVCSLQRCKGPGHPRSGQQGLLRRRLSECLFQPPGLSHPAFPLVATMACCCASRPTCRMAHPLRATDLDGPTSEAGRVDRGEDCGRAGRSTQRERATH